MKWIISVVTLAFLSPVAQARNLSCALSELGEPPRELLTQEIDLDRKPSGSLPKKVTHKQQQEKITLKGITGNLVFWQTATWYNNDSDGWQAGPLNNMNDTFPAIDIGAFFYEIKNGKQAPNPTLVTIRSDSAPGFNAYANNKEELYVIRDRSAADFSYDLNCVVKQ